MGPIEEKAYCDKLGAEIARLFGVDETDVCCDYIPRRGATRPLVLVSCSRLSKPIKVKAWGLLQALRRCGDKIDALQVLLDRVIGGQDGQ